jgi:hypothetical protein
LQSPIDTVMGVSTRLSSWKAISCGGLRRLPALDLPDDSLSTDRRQSVVNVHRFSSGTPKLCNSSLHDPDRVKNLMKAHI